MKLNKQLLIAAIPLFIFLLLLGFFWRGLSLKPREIPSALINKPVPVFSMQTLNNPHVRFTNRQLQGQVSLLNVWATWCVSCRAEHSVLMAIAKTNQVPIYGLDYKDERQTAQRWLKVKGNPFKENIFDGHGRLAIDWGVYGTPETFIIDKKGIIRYKFIGPMSYEDWLDDILPRVKQLQGRAV